jgi:hypothetical protein
LLLLIPEEQILIPEEQNARRSKQFKRQHALVLPALMLLLGWALLEADHIDGLAFLAFLGTPAAVLVLAWAAIVANETANRRSERQQRPWNFTKLSLFHLSVPAFMVLLG